MLSQNTYIFYKSMNTAVIHGLIKVSVIHCTYCIYEHVYSKHQICIHKYTNIFYKSMNTVVIHGLIKVSATMNNTVAFMNMSIVDIEYAFTNTRIYSTEA